MSWCNCWLSYFIVWCAWFVLLVVGWHESGCHQSCHWPGEGAECPLPWWWQWKQYCQQGWHWWHWDRCGWIDQPWQVPWGQVVLLDGLVVSCWILQGTRQPWWFFCQRAVSSWGHHAWWGGRSKWWWPRWIVLSAWSGMMTKTMRRRGLGDGEMWHEQGSYHHDSNSNAIGNSHSSRRRSTSNSLVRLMLSWN